MSLSGCSWQMSTFSYCAIQYLQAYCKLYLLTLQVKSNCGCLRKNFATSEIYQREDLEYEP